MRFRLPHSNEKKADRFEDLASSIQAGLSAGDSLGRSGAGILDALAHASIEVDSIERRVLESAEAAGELPAALRERAEGYRRLAALQRDILGRLAYPFVLVTAAILLTFWLASIGMGIGMTVPLVSGAALVLGVVGSLTLLQRAHANPDFPTALGPLRPLLLDYATLPYLSALQSLYRAGVPLMEAHDLASRTAPIGSVRATLMRSAAKMATDRTTLTEALTAHAALDAETLQLLRGTELVGELEDGLTRAVDRRRDVFVRRVHRATKTLGTVVYVFAVCVVGYVVLSFYSGMIGRIG